MKRLRYDRSFGSAAFICRIPVSGDPVSSVCWREVGSTGPGSVTNATLVSIGLAILIIGVFKGL